MDAASSCCSQTVGAGCCAIFAACQETRFVSCFIRSRCAGKPDCRRAAGGSARVSAHSCAACQHPGWHQAAASRCARTPRHDAANAGELQRAGRQRGGAGGGTPAHGGALVAASRCPRSSAAQAGGLRALRAVLQASCSGEQPELLGCSFPASCVYLPTRATSAQSAGEGRRQAYNKQLQRPRRRHGPTGQPTVGWRGHRSIS